MIDRIAAVSVDLDEVACYAEVHGVPAPADREAHVVYDRCLPRLRALLADLDIRATFFAIGRDLERETNRDAVRDLRLAGHEVANHSYDHRYDLTRLPVDRILDDIERGATIIEECCGERPVGFRAPGYTVTDSVFEALTKAGVLYDSSVFPCPSYYLAKTATLGWIGARGRRSQSILDRPSVLLAPRLPYRTGRPYWRRGRGIVELPIGVTRWMLPYIGTSLVVLGVGGARRLTAQIVGRPFVNLELHGIDVADPVDDHLQVLARYQPDLRRRSTEKVDALVAALDALHQGGYRFVTLREAAMRFGEPRQSAVET